MSYDKIWGTVHDAARTPVFSEIDRRQELYPGEDLPNQGKYEIVLGMFFVYLLLLLLDWGLIYRKF